MGQKIHLKMKMVEEDLVNFYCDNRIECVKEKSTRTKF